MKTNRFPIPRQNKYCKPRRIQANSNQGNSKDYADYVADMATKLPIAGKGEINKCGDLTRTEGTTTE